MSTAGEWMDAAREGDYAAAHAISDAVLAARDPATRDDPCLPYHLRWVWDGTAPDGADTLVRCYHGLGDTIQFSRYLPALRARAARLTLEVQPELAGFLADAADRVVPFDVARPLPKAACTLEIMELFHILRAAPDALPCPAPPLPADCAVGLRWEAGGWDPARSVPEARMAPLRRRRWASLQRPSGDVRETAGLLSEVDVMVTVDTMVAHLAGTLGRPTILLLRAHPDWRWGRGETTPWYPSMRLLRQAREGDWSGPVESAAALLDAWSASARPYRTLVT